jgi:hypothetical protein
MGAVDTHNPVMRHIGRVNRDTPGALPCAEALRAAAIHQRTGQALMALATTGIPKGIYRFTTHEAMNRQDDEALARAIAANVHARAASTGPTR